MNKAQLLSHLRTVGKAVGTYLTATGINQGSVATWVSGLVAFILSTVFSHAAHAGEGPKSPGLTGLFAWFVAPFGAGFAVVALFASGCATQLQSGGVYASQPFLYWADTTVSTTASALDAFESWELQNYSYLQTNSPAIVGAAETIRTNAPVYYQYYLTARSAYTNLVSTVTSNSLLSAVTTFTNLQTGAVTNAIP